MKTLANSFDSLTLELSQSQATLRERMKTPQQAEYHPWIINRILAAQLKILERLQVLKIKHSRALMKGSCPLSWFVLCSAGWCGF